eukprot:TRINITY_DN19086_c0_g1_i1.p1 TRINITY_DN19086_c0_g1~~TRINITY_DN19086_c0_g1_i1.p1  ORF type:complete len:397 (-),score=85.61 TRINITY_DN19086_c0_g1_i1:230-1420(-)
MLPAARSSEARTTALVDELLARFSTKTVQQKLDREVCKKNSVQDTQSPVAHSAQGMGDAKVDTQTACDASPMSLSKLDAACTFAKPKVPTIQRMAYAGANEQMAKKLEVQGVKESKYVTESAERRTSLNKTKALSLQTQLLKAFTAPAFQKKLHELVRRHNAVVSKSAEYHLAFRNLVRCEQIPIIKRYGFKASEEGVVDMLQEFERFGEDADLFVNSEAIKEALFSPSTPAPSVEIQEVEAAEKPENKEELLQLLRSLHENYSQPEFQAAVDSLKFFETDSRYAAAGYYHLPGRAELAAPIQEYVLPRFGFEASKEGVHEMIALCADYLMDRDVAGQVDAINSKLGMSPAACQRFRDLAIDLARAKQTLSLPESQRRPLRLFEPVVPGRFVAVVR